MKNDQSPLVSVPVITYNSSKTVVETLDSIYNQTYPNIELIVSDDCSTDNTVQVCREWIESHKERFVRTELLTVEKNTGTSANLNRAEAACQGEWVKGIAGDDLLLPDCIRDCVCFAKTNSSFYCFFGKIKAFGGNADYCNWLTNTFSERNDMMSRLSKEELFRVIVNGHTPPAPAFFYNRFFFLNNEIRNDERIPLIEDLPRWLSILKKGFVFGFFDKEIVKYRVGGVSTSKDWQSYELFKNRRLLFFLYQFEYFYNENSEKVIVDIVEQECVVYKELLSCHEQLAAIKNSLGYKVCRVVTYPYRIIKKAWKNNLSRL